MCMLRGGVHEGHALGEMADQMSGREGMCGRAPHGMSTKYRWSVPPSLIAQYGAPPTVDFKATCKLHDDRAADVMRRVWAYDPESRPQARDLADASESMFKKSQ